MSTQDLLAVLAVVVHELAGWTIYCGQQLIRVAYGWRRWAEQHGAQP